MNTMKAKCIMCGEYYGLHPGAIHSCKGRELKPGYKERSSMSISIGAEIEFGGEKFIVVDIKRQDTTDGKMLHITACDPTTADKEQQAKMKMGQTGENLIDVLRDTVEKLKRGEFGGM